MLETLHASKKLLVKKLLVITRPVLSWPCESSWSKGISLPRPIPYDLQTRMPFCSNWILCSLLKPSILFTSKDFLVSSTAQTHEDVPFTGRSESVHVCCCTYIMTLHVFIGHNIRSHTYLPYCGSKKSKRQTAIPTGWPRSFAAAISELLW